MKPEEYVMDAWKQQLDAGLRMVEALVEGATRIHEVQIDAAAETHADAVATQKALARAGDPSEIVRLQSEWASANARRCLAYWRDLHAAALQTQSEMLRCMERKPE
jgi:phasin family protein